MNKYLVDFEYYIPEFSSVELMADTEHQAKIDAEIELKSQYPEIEDLDIIRVTVLE